jgi:hypothetical protein
MVKVAILALATAVLAAGCGDGGSAEITETLAPGSPVAGDHAVSDTPVAPSPDEVEAVLPELLLTIDELPGRWVETDDTFDSDWRYGPCGMEVEQAPVASVHRAFVRDADDDAPVWYIAQAAFLLPSGAGFEFMSNLRGVVDACRKELEATDRSLVGGGAHFARVQSESQAYHLARHGCCYTPTPDHRTDPVDIVYLRRGDVIIYTYGSFGGSLLGDLAAAAEQRLMELE